MSVFRDGSGLEWVVEIDTWQLRVVRERTGFEIGKLLDDEMKRWNDLAADPVLFGSVLFALCADQVLQRGTTERQFHKGLAGEALESAHAAFRDAFVSFCPSRPREILRAAIGKGETIHTEIHRLQLEKISAIDPEKVAALNGSAGSSPAASESTPEG